jgi:hypothetical protein
LRRKVSRLERESDNGSRDALLHDTIHPRD